MELGELTTFAQGAAQNYWSEAVGPLHNLTWQTLTLFLMLAMAAALIVTALLHYSWVLSRPAIAGVKIAQSHHFSTQHLRLSVQDHLAFHKVVTGAMSEIAKEVRAEDQTKYYVVTVVQTKPVRELIYREMRLQAPSTGQASLRPGVVQLDARDLSDVRRRNSFDSDNAPGTEIDGTYNVYIRPVEWYDVRHWLMHPNREIRILIWVTLITTLVPTLLSVLFG